MGHTLLPAASCAVPTVHPHIRGAYIQGGDLMVVKRGSSPHTWGIRDTDIFSAAVVRFIPTYVGHTWRVFLLERSETVHPHIRGAYRRGRYSEADSYGSSPHTWGIRTASTEYRSGLRFIPTYVGHTTIPSLSTVQYAVHPHIRGAYGPVVIPGIKYRGSSPHTWGIHFFPPPQIGRAHV